MIKVLDKGFVELVDCAASDLDVVNGARVSLHKESKELTDADKGLIKYLMRERHGTPFEQGHFKFRIKAPIFVFREWHRHRIGWSYNEWSARYSQLEPDFYIPSVDEVVTQVGKPGHYTFEKADRWKSKFFVDQLRITSNRAYKYYEDAINQGIAKQQARLFLPVNTYSEMIASCNPRSLMNFLSLRNSEQAQAEIRKFAEALEEIFKNIMPTTYESFIENGRIAP